MSSSKVKKLIKVILIHMIIGAIVVAIVLITDGFCIFKAITHVDCPGCGLTRAYLAFFRGDFSGAIHYHPMFWAVPIMLMIAAHTRLIKNKKISIPLIVIFILLALAYVGVYVFKPVVIY